ncbi:MAG: PepSY domain-containing protein [Ketobacter sp.]
MRFLRLALPVVLACAMSAAGAEDIDHDDALSLRRSGALLPLQTLLLKVREHYPGATLLEAELERDDGLYIYELEVLTASGQVRELEFNAGNGDLLEDEVDD